MAHHKSAIKRIKQNAKRNARNRHVSSTLKTYIKRVREAVEAKDAFFILTRYIKREKITRAEKKQFRKQLIELLKSAGVVVPVMLIPLPFISTLLLIIMDHLLLSMNIKILPSSFYPEVKEGLLTTEGVEKDLELVEKSEKG